MTAWMTEYPEHRTVSWFDDVSDAKIGQCLYIRADLHEALQAENERLRREVYDKDRALRFIAQNPRRDNCVHMVMREAAINALK